MSVTAHTPVAAADLAALATLANAKLSPATPFSFATCDTVDKTITEINRIRLAIHTQIFENETSPIYRSKDTLLSGPWVVGVNDPINHAAAAGRLFPGREDFTEGNYGNIEQLSASYLPLFNEVEFYFSAPPETVVTLTQKLVHFDINHHIDDEYTVRSTSLVVSATGLHPTLPVRKISLADYDLTEETEHYGWAEMYEITPATLAGCWVAKTLPTPAVNVYLDPDLPPYVDFVYDGTTGEAAVHHSSLYSSGTTLLSLYRTGMNGFSPLVPGPESSEVFRQVPVAAGQNFTGSFWMPDRFQFLISDPELPPYLLIDPVWTIYLSLKPGIDPDNSSTYGLAEGSGLVTYEAMLAAFPSLINGGQVCFLIRNPTTSPTTLTIDYSRFARMPLPALRTVLPQAALWPVMRDTDDYPFTPWDWGDSERELAHHTFYDPWRAVTTLDTIWLQPGQTYTDFLFASNVTGTGLRYRLAFSFSGGIALPVYYSHAAGIDPDDPGTFDFVKLNGTPALFPPDGGFSNQNIFLLIKNTTANPVRLSAVWEWEMQNTLNPEFPVPFESVPPFFPIRGSMGDVNNTGRTATECFSYILDNYGSVQDMEEVIHGNLLDSQSVFSAKPVPQLGYCIFEVLARRNPVAGRVPATGAALAVKVGVFRGTHYTEFTDLDKGTFDEFITITIPENQPKAVATVFWPVVCGQPLVYQCSEKVQIKAVANWQPIFHCPRYNLNADYNGYPPSPDSPGSYFAATWFTRALKFYNRFCATQTPYSYDFYHADDADYIAWYGAEYDPANPGTRQARRVIYPFHAVIYNDLEAILNLIAT